MSFLGSIPGQFFREFGITVVVAVLFSLLVARRGFASAGHFFLKPTAEPHPRGDLIPIYRRVLEWALYFPVC